MTGARLRIGVLGAGNVGREVVSALLASPDGVQAPGAAPLELAAVVVRDVDRAVAAGLPASIVSDAPAHVVADDDIDVVVELMGGAEPAHTLIGAALAMGKSVVTANKHVIAHHGAELETIARRTGAALRFEAAVAAGIPILGTLASDLAGDRVTRVRGIVNGTTNFILTAMSDETEPLDFEAALAEAQRLGYAEADPSGDIEGLDAANKLAILARLAFDRWLDPGAIATRPDGTDGPAGPGITAVSRSDQAEARANGRVIRLVASTTLDGDGGLRAAVLPTALGIDSRLGRTAGVRNRIEVDAERAGDLGFDGPGAGGTATSSAVLGDLLAIARGGGSTWGARPEAAAVAPGAVRRPDADVLETSSGMRYPVGD